MFGLPSKETVKQLEDRVYVLETANAINASQIIKLQERLRQLENQLALKFPFDLGEK